VLHQGMHLVAYFCDGSSDIAIEAAAQRAGIVCARNQPLLSRSAPAPRCSGSYSRRSTSSKRPWVEAVSGPREACRALATCWARTSKMTSVASPGAITVVYALILPVFLLVPPRLIDTADGQIPEVAFTTD